MLARNPSLVILGAGFAGSLCALGAHRLGHSVLVLDKARHPRFAIGESSTPVANRVLHDLAVRYDLPRLLPLTKYGPWQRTYPTIVSGLKRGFSYFAQQPGLPFRPDPAHGNELLVAASAHDETSDTQWLRASVDAFLAAEVRAAGIELWEGVQLAPLEHRGPGDWRLSGRRGALTDLPAAEEPFEITTPLLIDGTGEASVVARTLGIEERRDQLRTRSRSLFSHFTGVGSWRSWLADHGGDVACHPFPCDDAAQHMLLDGAWMWVLRFNNGVTSAGLAIDEHRHPLPDGIRPEEEWADWLRTYPSVGEMLADTQVVTPPGRLVRTGRIQRRWARAVGVDWVALPHTAGFIDPLHSTGIAHSLCGVERLLHLLGQTGGGAALAAALPSYEATVFREIDLIDLLVAGCYRTLGRFRLFATWSMLYFAAATTYERRRATEGYAPQREFLNADDATFRGLVERLYDELGSVEPGEDAERRFEERVARALEPYNHVGLFDPAAQNLYRYTVAPDPASPLPPTTR